MQEVWSRASPERGQHVVEQQRVPSALVGQRRRALGQHRRQRVHQPLRTPPARRHQPAEPLRTGNTTCEVSSHTYKSSSSAHNRLLDIGFSNLSPSRTYKSLYYNPVPRRVLSETNRITPIVEQDLSSLSPNLRTGLEFSRLDSKIKGAQAYLSVTRLSSSLEKI
jgi:hypothetical protein